MDGTKVLEAIRALKDPLEYVIWFSREESDSADGAWFLKRTEVTTHWEESCDYHSNLSGQYDDMYHRLKSLGYPAPASWWLPDFVPQVAYLECQEDDKFWLLGTMPLHRLRSPETSQPMAGVVIYAGGTVQCTHEEAIALEGVVDESVVIKWERVYEEICETERRLVELQLHWQPGGREDEGQQIEGFLSAELRTKLDISQDTLRNYATKASIPKPVGRGRSNFQYSPASVLTLCEWIAGHVDVKDTVDKAKILASKIRNKTDNTN